jgi:His/Glu/Gln/Arg/opine family amino acid ABC transporter permease subunit
MPEVILQNMGFLLAGLRLTLELAIVTALGGTLLGVVAGTLRYLRVPGLSQLSTLYIEFFRGTPLLVVLLITYFAFPALLSYRTTAYQAAMLGFVIFIGAYLAEDIRSGLMSVRRGLIQAGFASGLTRVQVFRFIIFPQAIRRVIPTLFNQYVRLFKFTSVASVIGVHEFTGSALLVNARVFEPLTIILTIAIVYLVICYGISLVGRMLYSHFAVRT